jgi:hypothetical protein
MSHLTKKDYQDALDVQSACNLGAVVHSFSRVMNKIQATAREEMHGTDWINEHPITRMYVEQLVHLSKGTSYNTAYDACSILAKE